MYNFDQFLDNSHGIIGICHSYNVVVNGIVMVKLYRENCVGLQWLLWQSCKT